MVRLPMRHRWLSFLLIACFAHAPVPWFHRHADLEAGALQRHLASFHSGQPRPVEPEQGHWHVVLLGTNLAGTPCRTNDEEPSPESKDEGPLKQFPWSASTSAGEFSDLEVRGGNVLFLSAGTSSGCLADRSVHHLHPLAVGLVGAMLGGSTRAAYQTHLCVWRL